MPKDRLTVFTCANMLGEKKGLLVIGKSKNPRCFKGVSMERYNYEANKNVWMTSDILKNMLCRGIADYVETAEKLFYWLIIALHIPTSMHCLQILN